MRLGHPLLAISIVSLVGFFDTLQASWTDPPRQPGTIVTVEIGERPLTGSYLKSMASLNSSKPAALD